MEANDDARATLAHFHTIIESAVDAIVTIDDAGTILFVNAATERMFGYPREALVGASIDRLVPPRARSHAEHLRAVGAAGTHAVIGRSREVQAQRQDGSLLAVEIAVTRTRLGRREVFTGIVRDVTGRNAAREALARANASLAAEIARHTAELRAARHRADASDRAKDAFLAVVSHELRTPINAVLGGVSLLLDTPLSPEQQEYAAIAMHGSEALLALVDDVLTYTALEGGDAAIIPAPIDLRELVAEAVAAMRPEATAKTLDLRLVLDPALPARVTGDALRLRQVLRLLLQNAIKFTEAGGVTLALDLFNGSGGPPTVRFAVLDTGIGIPPERVSAVFDHFAQADGSSTRRHGGLGLGLAIVRRLVTRMGGTIDVASIPDRGSTFWFTVPFIAADAPPGYGATNPS